MLEASIRLATRLSALGCERLIGTGTCFEYDTDAGTLSEASPTKPRNLYAAAKLAFSLLLPHIAAAGGMRCTWARLFYQYGPMEDPARLIPSIVRALLEGRPAPITGGKQVRDYLHVADVASALHTIATSQVEGIINLGSGEPVTVAEIATRIGAALDRPELVALGARPYDPGDPMFICADVARLKATGWRPTYNLDAGLADTIAWWRARLRSA
jgi:nucleoside-diphosphate-sugar epimerase